MVVAALLLSFCAVAVGADSGPSAEAAARCRGAVATIVGTAGNDRLVGTRRADVIVPRGGNDVVRAGGGNDKVCDSGGRDRLNLGAGKDQAGGGGGADVIVGGGGNDRLDGGGGNDRISGGAGKDRIGGGSGDDTLIGGAGNDNIAGGPGTDDCRGGPGRNTIRTCENGGPPNPPNPPDLPPMAVADSRTVAEDDAAQVIDVLANDTDPDGGAPKSIASVTQPLNGTVVIAGGGNALTYRPNPNYCNSPGLFSTDDFSYTLTPGGSAASVAVTVTCVNDAPVVSTTASTLVYSQGVGPLTVDTGLGVADIDSASLAGATVAITTNFNSAEDELMFANQLGITGTYDSGTGVLTLTGSASVSDYQAALRSVRFQSTNSNPPASKAVEFRANDGEADSAAATRNIEITPPNSPPVADDETFNGSDGAIGNTTLVVNDPDDGAPSPSNPKKTISGDILAGDTDVDGPGPLTVTPGPFATNDGGSVTIEADGDFIYQPAASTSCTDTSDFFDYTVTDSGSPEQSDVGRVTIAIAGCVWYVNNNASGNSGTSAAPFDTLAQAESASGSNHTVFVFDGDNTSTGYDTGYQMNAGERLIGEHEGLTVDPDGGGGLGSETLQPANAGAHPTLTATGEDVVSLDDGNEVRGFVLDPQGTGGGIEGASGDTGGGAIDDVRIIDTGTGGTQPGLELDSTSGTFNVSDLEVDNSAATGTTSGSIGVRLNNAGTVNFGSTGKISLVTAGARGLDAFGTSMGTSTFDDITVTGSGTGGVDLTNTTGTTTFGDGVGTDLALTTTSGSAAAFRLSSAGTASLPSGGTANVSATGGPAVDITGTTATGGFSFDDVDSTGSVGDGINLSGLGSGDFSADSNSTLGGAAVISFDIDGGSGTVTFPGTFNNGSGHDRRGDRAQRRVGELRRSGQRHERRRRRHHGVEQHGRLDHLQQRDEDVQHRRRRRGRLQRRRWPHAHAVGWRSRHRHDVRPGHPCAGPWPLEPAQHAQRDGSHEHDRQRLRPRPRGHEH